MEEPEAATRQQDEVLGKSPQPLYASHGRIIDEAHSDLRGSCYA